MLYIYILLIDPNLCCHHFIPVWYLELTTTYVIAIYDIWNIFKMHICQTSSQSSGINKILKITVFESTYMNWHCLCEINVRENRRGNQEWTIQKIGNTGYTWYRTKTKTTTHNTKRKLQRWATRTLPKIRGEHRFSRRVRSLCYNTSAVKCVGYILFKIPIREYTTRITISNQSHEHLV